MHGPSCTLAQQAFALRAMFPSSLNQLGATRLRWTGVITPSELSRAYTVRIDYQLGFQPRVMVLDPVLEPDIDGFLPHMYDNNSLCLHETGQWTPQMLIVDTLVPWAAEWLLHYEIWLATHTWLGDDDTEPAPPAARFSFPSMHLRTRNSDLLQHPEDTSGPPMRD